MPHTLSQLMRFFGAELMLWGTVFIVVGFRISGITASQLRLVTKKPLREPLPLASCGFWRF